MRNGQIEYPKNNINKNSQTGWKTLIFSFKKTQLTQKKTNTHVDISWCNWQKAKTKGCWNQQKKAMYQYEGFSMKLTADSLSDKGCHMLVWWYSKHWKKWMLSNNSIVCKTTLQIWKRN